MHLSITKLCLVIPFAFMPQKRKDERNSFLVTVTVSLGIGLVFTSVTFEKKIWLFFIKLRFIEFGPN